MSAVSLDLNKQLQLLEQVRHYAESGSAEDCENLLDLFKVAFLSIENPSLQIKSIREILPKNKDDLYQPDKITLLAREGIESVSREMANLLRKP